MTDCNANQLVVKAQIENECVPAPNQQVAMAAQPQAIRTVPGSLNTTAGQHVHAREAVEVHTPTDNQPTTAPSPSLAGNAPSTPDAVTADASGSSKPAHIDVDPGCQILVPLCLTWTR